MAHRQSWSCSDAFVVPEQCCPFDPAAALAAARAAARTAGLAGNSPIAAVAVDAHGVVLATETNRQWVTGDVTAHAERLLLSHLAALGVDSTAVWIVSNAEPCSMCASAMIKAKVAGVVFGAPAEPSMDPWLPLTAVVAASRHQLVVVGPIDGDVCAAEIAAGRATARFMRAGRN